MLVQVSQLNPTIGDLKGNLRKALEALERARRNKAEVVLFPELTLSGYPPEDLLLDPAFIDAIESLLSSIAPATKGLFAAIGLPRWNPKKKEKPLLNSAAIFIDGKLVGYKDKTLLPTYDVFDERRYFEPGAGQPIFEFQGRKIGVTICEDLWQHANEVGYTDYRVDPVEELQGIDLLLNLSASPYYYKRTDARLSVVRSAALALRVPVILCNQVGANDQLVFDGHSLFVNEKGELSQMAKGFVEEDLLIDLSKQAAAVEVPSNGIQDLYSALVLGLRDYFHKQRFSKAILGLSGGVDSALVACIAADALGPEHVLALALPSRFSSKSSVSDAAELAKTLKMELKTISIDEIYQNYLDLLKSQFPLHELTQENLQARIRGMILMAHSNNSGSILLNTSNKSESAMGYTTIYGDLCGGIGVLLDVTKRHVYDLCRYLENRIPRSILEKPPSAELRLNQKDEDTLPPYAILDPILEEYIEERRSIEEIAEKTGQSKAFVEGIVKQIHRAEYKRRQAPIAIRVTQKSFSKGRNVPIVQKWIF